MDRSNQNVIFAIQVHIARGERIPEMRPVLRIRTVDCAKQRPGDAGEDVYSSLIEPCSDVLVRSARHNIRPTVAIHVAHG